MYKLIVAEDEKYARNYVCKFLSVQFSGVFQVFSACDGKEALEIIENNSIDVVITDIKMPEMTGLELAREIYENHSNIFVIITSGYEEFEYAKSAIKYNVKEYFVKPFELSELKNVLDGFRNILDSKASNNVFDDTEDLSEERERFFVDLIYGRTTNKTNIIKRSVNLKFPFDIENTPCELITLKIGNYENFLEEKWKYSKDSLNYAINNLVSGFLEYSHSYCINSQYGYFDYIVYHKKEDVVNYSDIANKINNILKLPITIHKKNKTLNSLDELLYCRCENDNIAEQVIIFLSYLKEDKKDEAIKIIADFVNGENCIDNFSIFLEQLAHYSDSIYTEQISKIKFSESADVIYRRITDIFGGLKENYNECIERAKKFIDENYDKNISREDVAKVAYFSPTYFTKNFKIYTGENFNDYLLKIRMEKAIELLKQNKYKIYEIAKKTGYENTKYFFHVFKQYTTYTPKDYIVKVLGRENSGEK